MNDLVTSARRDPAPVNTDARRARGSRSRDAALRTAVQLASTDGLEGLTIGRLATELAVSKSSVFALFGSKEQLQLATLAVVRDMFVDLVIRPAMQAEEGLERLRVLGASWVSYLASDVLDGGCLLCSASAEMDGRPGPVRNELVAIMGAWSAFLTNNLEVAVSKRELLSVDPAAMAFRLNALGMAANWQRQLFRDTHGLGHAGAAWTDELDRAASRKAKA